MRGTTVVKRNRKGDNPYEQHILQLARKKNIRVHYYDRNNNNAYSFELLDKKKTKAIACNQPKTEMSYLVALHEIGHIYTDSYTRFSYSSAWFCVTQEKKAWKWAKQNAIKWTPKMEKRMIELLNTYIEWSDQEFHKYYDHCKITD